MLVRVVEIGHLRAHQKQDRTAVYGLRQAGRQWYRKLKEALNQMGLKQTISDPHSFVTHKVVDGFKCTLILPVYVDDLLPLSNKVLTDEFEKWIGNYFETTMPTDAEYFLGLRLRRDRTAEIPWLTLDQHQFIQVILNRFEVTPGKATTPFASGYRSIPNSESKEDNDPDFIRSYQSKLGSLMYLMLGTRLDIAFTVGALGRYSANPSVDHMNAIDRLFRYVDYTKELSLRYHNNGGNAIKPNGAVDADLAGEPSESRSTRGYVFFLSGTAFSWSSKLLDTIASSTAESEYMSLFFGGQQVAWLRNLYEEIGFPLSSPISVNCDSQPAIQILKGEGDHTRSKHFALKFHASRQRVERKEMEVKYIVTGENPADILTKSLSGPLHAKGVEALGLVFEEVPDDPPAEESPVK